jgi:hypothetical protein
VATGEDGEIAPAGRTHRARAVWEAVVLSPGCRIGEGGAPPRAASAASAAEGLDFSAFTGKRAHADSLFLKDLIEK